MVSEQRVVIMRHVFRDDDVRRASGVTPELRSDPQAWQVGTAGLARLALGYLRRTTHRVLRVPSDFSKHSGSTSSIAYSSTCGIIRG